MSDIERLRRTGETFRSVAAWLFAGGVLGVIAGVRSPLLGVAVAGLAVVLALRTWRAEVRLGADAVVVRGLLRTRVIAYGTIVAVAAVRSGPGSRTQVVEIRCEDGTRVRADSIGCAPGPPPHGRSDVDAMVAAIERRRGTARGATPHRPPDVDDPTPGTL